MGQTGFSKTASWIALTAVAVTLRLVSKLSGMHSGQDTLDRASASMLVLPYLAIFCQALCMTAIMKTAYYF